jgi:dipeptidyl aminopeptidase/acylaminoacyl peptidase
MRHLARSAAVVLAFMVPVCASAQEATLPIPANVKLEGVPPIPASIPDRLTPYGSARRAQMVAWHPARRQILISTSFGNTTQIHQVNGPGMDRAQLTFFREGISNLSAAYEPARGEYFVLTKDTGGGAESVQIFRFDVATGRATMVTDGKSRYGSPVWSHKSGLIAVESSRRNGKDRDIYVMNPLEPSSLKLVAQTEGTWYVMGWSPDDSELLALEAPTNEQKFIWRVKVATGEKIPMTAGDNANWVFPEYSPDGKYIYGLSNHGGDTARIWRTEAASPKWTALTKDGEGVESFALSPDGRTLGVIFDSTTASRFELLDAATGALRVAPKLPPGVLLGAPVWRPGGAEVAVTLRSLRTWGDVYSVNAKTGAVERWTSSELGPFNPESLPEPQIVKWKSFDGVEISGVLYRPPARFTGPRPVIINIHGGPNGANARERPRFQGRSAYYLNDLGVAMIFPNVRGSFGFGREFEHLDDGPLRENAVKDIGALLDWIGQQPYLDKARVGVTGASYGGYMTYAVAAMYSDRIRCAAAGAGISDFLTYLQSTDLQRQSNRRAEYGDETDPAMREVLTRISPVTNASKIHVPLMIIHGRKDTRVPIGQAEEMARVVRANNVPVWTVIFEDEGHTLPSTNANNDFYFYAWMMFVDKYLLGDAPR